MPLVCSAASKPTKQLGHINLSDSFASVNGCTLFKARGSVPTQLFLMDQTETFPSQEVASQYVGAVSE